MRVGRYNNPPTIAWDPGVHSPQEYQRPEASHLGNNSATILAGKADPKRQESQRTKGNCKLTLPEACHLGTKQEHDPRPTGIQKLPSTWQRHRPTHTWRRPEPNWTTTPIFLIKHKEMWGGLRLTNSAVHFLKTTLKWLDRHHRLNEPGQLFSHSYHLHAKLGEPAAGSSVTIWMKMVSWRCTLQNVKHLLNFTSKHACARNHSIYVWKVLLLVM